MKILVLGATGATGRLVTTQALNAGVHVRALVRSPEKLPMGDPRLEVVTGQATRADDVARAMVGIDAVVSTLGAAKGTVVTDAVDAVLKAANAHNVKRVILLASCTVLRDRLTTPLKLLSGLAMGARIRDQATAVNLLTSSALDWTVVYAVRLTDGSAAETMTERTTDTTLGMGRVVARADVASYLLASARGETEDTSTRRRAVVLSTV